GRVDGKLRLNEGAGRGQLAQEPNNGVVPDRLLQTQDIGGPQRLRRKRGALHNGARGGGRGLIEGSVGPLRPLSRDRMMLRYHLRMFGHVCLPTRAGQPYSAAATAFTIADDATYRHPARWYSPMVPHRLSLLPPCVFSGRAYHLPNQDVSGAAWLRSLMAY